MLAGAFNPVQRVHCSQHPETCRPRTRSTGSSRIRQQCCSAQATSSSSYDTQQNANPARPAFKVTEGLNRTAGSDSSVDLTPPSAAADNQQRASVGQPVSEVTESEVTEGMKKLPGTGTGQRRHGRLVLRKRRQPLLRTPSAALLQVLQPLR